MFADDEREADPPNQTNLAISRRLDKMRQNPVDENPAYKVARQEAKRLQQQNDAGHASLKDVEKFCKHLGLDLTPYGVGAALLSIASDYSPAETASHFAVVTIARDMKLALHDTEKILSVAICGAAMLEVLREWKDENFVRESFWRNDTNAIGNIIIPGPETENWINRVLRDTFVSEAVATNRVLSNLSPDDPSKRYRKAAEQGHGVPQDYVSAHMWLNLAAAQGEEKAAERRDYVAALMTPEQIAEAQRLARKWKPISER